MTAAGWARELKIPISTIISRKRRGWSDERALIEPVATNDNKVTKNDAELYLNDLARFDLPDNFKVLLDGVRTTKPGQFIRRYFTKQFDRWFNEKYKPNKQNEK